jgi:hypothetical protein
MEPGAHFPIDSSTMRARRSGSVTAGKNVAQDPRNPHHRASERLSFITFAWYRRVDDEAQVSEQGVARSCDISDTGAGLVTSRELPAGSRIFLEVTSRVGNLSAIAVVAHCAPTHDGCFRVGLRIEFVPPTDQMTLQRIIAPSGSFPAGKGA